MKFGPSSHTKLLRCWLLLEKRRLILIVLVSCRESKVNIKKHE